MADNDKSPVKQAAVTPKSLRVSGFRGAFMDANFDDDGVSTAPVSAETATELNKQFPKAKIEIVGEGADANAAK